MSAHEISPAKQREIERMMKPALSDAQWQRLIAFGEPQDVAEGEYLFRAGDLDYDLILVDTGEVEIVRVAFGWVDETVVGTMGPRSFVGELGLLNGQGAFLSARASRAGRMLRVSRARLRLLMAEDDELCDIVLHALWARREMLRRGPAALTLKLVGSPRRHATSSPFGDSRSGSTSSTRRSSSPRATSACSASTGSPSTTSPSRSSRASRWRVRRPAGSPSAWG